MMDKNSDNRPILLFDGVCNLCNSSVQFVIKHDKNGKIALAALQSNAGQQLLKAHQLPEKNLKSLVFIENNRAYTKSDGALRASRYLDGGWKWLYSLIIFPAFLRNWVYDIVAKNRYRWFGRQESCWMPTPELRKRFLD